MAAAFFLLETAHAHADTYVDLSVEITVDSKLHFNARNHGTTAAYGVTVDIELADQTIIELSPGQFNQKSGTTCSDDFPYAATSCASGIWTVGKLGAGEEIGFTITPKLASGLPCCTGISDRWTAPTRAVIKNTVPVEEVEGNNTAVGWMSLTQDRTHAEGVVGRYWLEASVDDLLPEPGDTVNFNFEFSSASSLSDMRDVRVRSKLDDGMGTPTASTSTLPMGTTFDAAQGLTRTWDWNIGTPTTRPLNAVVSTTLDDPLPTGVARSDLCLTAELTARPSNVGVSDRVTYTSAEICLREDPATLLQEGETHLFAFYPCVGVSTYPCSSSDTLELLVNGGEAARAAGIMRDEAVMKPERVFVHLPDQNARHVDGSTLTWRTAASGAEGVTIGENFDEIDSSVWSNFADKLTVTDVDGGTKPGTMKLCTPNCVTLIADADTGDFEDAYNPDPSYTDHSLGVFGALGTYVAKRTTRATHNNGTATTTDDVVYTATGTYTFHVGPVAELAVRDGEGGLAPAGTRAFTIVAANNGPDDAAAVQVTVTGLNAGDYVSHTVTAGAFATSTGVWTIGEMREPGYQQDIYGRDGEVLTIITSAAVGTEITAEIENTQDYEVCIDNAGEDVVLASPSSTACTTEDATNTWHSTAYYDYLTDNSTTTIKAKAGTGADLPGLQSAQEDTASIVITWNALSEVNGRPVTHYEVQRQTNPWETVAKVLETSYVDSDVEEGETFQYRIRAVNDWDHKSPWSPPMTAMVEAPVTDTTDGTTDGLVEALLAALAGASQTLQPRPDPVPSDADFEWNITHDIEALAGGHDAATGMWGDGETLWLLQDGAGAGDAIYAYDLETGERDEPREFALAAANRAPRGLWSDGATAWVSDSDSNHVYAYVLTTGERLEDRDIELDERNPDARGIWSDGETLWVLDGRRGALFGYDLASGELLAEFALAPDNGDPHGAWSDGVSIWVSDHAAKRLFAYRLPAIPADGAPLSRHVPALERVRTEEFTQLSRAGNNSPRGLWSDGDVMYVADAYDDRVYTFNMPDAIDARLASLTLSGVDIGVFAAGEAEYQGLIREGVTVTTVEADAAQSGATVAVAPADADEAARGHQAALPGASEVAVTVTSEDGTRTRVYRVTLVRTGAAVECLRGDIAGGFSLVIYEGGSIEDLAACAESLHVTALYALEGGRYVTYIVGAPPFVNAPFGALYAQGVPPFTALVAHSDERDSH